MGMHTFSCQKSCRDRPYKKRKPAGVWLIYKLTRIMKFRETYSGGIMAGVTPLKQAKALKISAKTVTYLNDVGETYSPVILNIADEVKLIRVTIDIGGKRVNALVV